MSAADPAEWLRMSRQDLDAARALAANDPPLIEPALYHCAQAAEKALKSVVVDAKLVPQKTHDVVVLRRVALTLLPSLPVDEGDAELLAGYAVDPRYPGGAGAYTDGELADALAAAARVVRAVEEA